MISRRGFFGMLAGLAVAPVLAPLIPEQKICKMWIEDSRPHWDNLKTYKIEPIDYDKYIVRFKCGTGEMGTLWWSKEKA